MRVGLPTRRQSRCGLPSSSGALGARLSFGLGNAFLLVGQTGRDEYVHHAWDLGEARAQIGFAWFSWPALILLATSAVCLLVVAARQGTRTSRRPGMAARRQVQGSAGRRRLHQRAAALRPSMTRTVTSQDLGYHLGESCGVACFCSVEDSVVVLGPPRAGKGLHLAIPLILDSPGAVLTTSTRPDNLTATLRRRAARGPVAVFDPQGLAPGIPSATRWSPIRGCEHPHTAMVRAKALTSDTAAGTTDSNFWQASAEQAVRCLLHAAALGGYSCSELYRWSLSAVHAREAVQILNGHPDAAAGWHQGLDAIISADPRQRDSVWAMVTIVFSALADPRVMDALSPSP